MDFLNKLTEIMRRHGMNKMSLAQVSGIPYTTIDGFYKKGYSNAKLSTLKKLSHALNVSIDFLTDDDRDFDTLHFPDMAEDERSLITSYRSLNEAGKQKLQEYASDLIAAGNQIKKIQSQ